MDLVHNPVHHPLEEFPREVESLGGHKVCGSNGTEDNDLMMTLVEALPSKFFGETYIAVDSLVTHNTDSAARVNGGIG
jgi:hypothetical protein